MQCITQVCSTALLAEVEMRNITVPWMLSYSREEPVFLSFSYQDSVAVSKYFTGIVYLHNMWLDIATYVDINRKWLNRILHEGLCSKGPQGGKPAILHKTLKWVLWPLPIHGLLHWPRPQHQQFQFHDWQIVPEAQRMILLPVLALPL